MNAIDIDSEIERLDRVILAAEKWSELYKKNPENHARLIKLEAKIDTAARRYFRGLADRVVDMISWSQYEIKVVRVTADDIDVIVTIDDTRLGYEDFLFIDAMFDTVADVVELGAVDASAIYDKPTGISKTTANVQRAARELIAELVGKKLDKDGNIVDNPRAKYRIHDQTRRDIRESVRTSLSLGEEKSDAVARLRRTIRNPKRAEMIARTETVNAYQRGLLLTATETGATHKEWMTTNRDDICGVYAGVGIVKLDHEYDTFTKRVAPPAHPNCRCTLRLVYPEELGNL